MEMKASAEPKNAKKRWPSLLSLHAVLKSTEALRSVFCCCPSRLAIAYLKNASASTCCDPHWVDAVGCVTFYQASSIAQTDWCLLHSACGCSWLNWIFRYGFSPALPPQKLCLCLHSTIPRCLPTNHLTLLHPSQTKQAHQFLRMLCWEQAQLNKTGLNFWASAESCSLHLLQGW